MLGMEKEIGSLENGKRADIVMMRLDAPARRTYVQRVFATCLCAKGLGCADGNRERPRRGERIARVLTVNVPHGADKAAEFQKINRRVGSLTVVTALIYTFKVTGA